LAFGVNEHLTVTAQGLIDQRLKVMSGHREILDAESRELARGDGHGFCIVFLPEEFIQPRIA
jgi:hypothetical protein